MYKLKIKVKLEKLFFLVLLTLYRMRVCG